MCRFYVFKKNILSVICYALEPEPKKRKNLAVTANVEKSEDK